MDQRCVLVVGQEETAPEQGLLPPELFEGLGISRGYKLSLDASRRPQILTFGDGGEVVLLRWDGFSWQRREVFPSIPHKPFDNTNFAQRADGRLALCSSDTAGRLLYVEEREGSWSEEVIVEEPGDHGPQSCHLSFNSKDEPLITYYTGDIPRWFNGAGQTRLMLARRSDAQWRAELISDTWHGIPVAMVSSGVLSQVFVGQLYGSARQREDRTYRLPVVGDLPPDMDNRQLLPFVGRPATDDAVCIHGDRTYIMHVSGDGSSSFKLLLSRSTERSWSSHLLATGVEEGDLVQSLVMLPDPEHDDAIELFFMLTESTQTIKTIKRASLRGDVLSVRPLELEGVEGITGVDAAMDRDGTIHLVYGTQGSEGLGYWVGR